MDFAGTESFFGESDPFFLFGNSNNFDFDFTLPPYPRPPTPPCTTCRRLVGLCTCVPKPTFSERLASEARIRNDSAVLLSSQSSNEADPLTQSQEMENSGAVALAAQTTPLPNDTYTNQLAGGMMQDSYGQPSLDMNTPVHLSSVNFAQASNIRGSGDQGQHVSLADVSPTSDERVEAANTLAFIQPNDLDQEEGPPYEGYVHSAGYSVDATHPHPVENMLGEDSDDEEVRLMRENDDARPAQGYAKLDFADGDYVVNTRQVVIGRNMEVYNQMKDAKRLLKEDDWRAQQEKEAQKDLDNYEAEPSHPSLAESDTGGVLPLMMYGETSEHNSRRSRKGKRKRNPLLQSKSSSTTNSIAPASLHLPQNGDITANLADIDDNDDEESRFIPIHSPDLRQTKMISQSHVKISYDSRDACWKLHVLGKSVFVNETLHLQGSIIPLESYDVVQIVSIPFTFRLPDNFGGQSPDPSNGALSKGTFAEGVESSDGDEEMSQLRTSPAVQRALNAFEIGDDEPTEMGPERKKAKLKLKTTIPTDKAKSKKAKAASVEPEAAVKSEKAKKPKTAVKEENDTKAPSPPQAPINLEPGSIFEGVAPEELPQKRKGPGRPPKNGLVSKRDASILKRMQKEYEKRGEKMPPHNVMIERIRAENKRKEAAAKAAAQGQPPPPEVVQSIEPESSAGASGPAQAPAGLAGEQNSATPAEPMRKPSSPRPKLIARSPSPMKPESECTEEELRKPTQTYIYLLDEVLRNHPNGKADLQDIYDRICKRWPYYKYKTGTAGWQSSVRHNLAQNDRFKEDGRSGKGKLWTIDYNVPLEKEKKRRTPPPPQPRPQMPMQNGLFPPPPPGQMPQYGQAPPGASWGQLGMNHPQPPAVAGNNYYSPYSQQMGQAPGYGPPPPHGLPPTYRNSQTPHQPPSWPQPNGAPQGYQAPAQNPNTPRPFDGIVQEILAFRTRYLSQFLPEGSAAYVKHEAIFSRCVTIHSDELHELQKPENSEFLKDEEVKKVDEEMKMIFVKWESLKPKKSQTPAPAPAPAASAVPAPPTEPTGSAEQPVTDSNGAAPVPSNELPTVGDTVQPPPQAAGTKRSAEDETEEGEEAKRARLA